MLTHKIRDMPQHVFRNSTQSPSSQDSNNSLSAAAAASVAFQQQMQQQSQLSESHLRSAETVLNLSDSSDRRLHRQLKALTTTASEKDTMSDFDKNVSNRTLTGADQSHPTYLSSDDSSSMPSPIQSKNGANNFGSRSGGGANTTNSNNIHNNSDNGIGDREDDDGDDGDDNNEVQRRTRSSAAMKIPRHEIKTPTKRHKAEGDRSNKETERKIEKPLTKPDYCQICSKRFDSLAALETHMRSHKQHLCTICDKSFSTKGNLKVIQCLPKTVCFSVFLQK